MVHKDGDASGFNWRAQVVVALLVAVGLLAFYSFCDSDSALMINLLAIIPVLLLTGIGLLIAAAITKKWRRYLAQLSYLAIALILCVSFLIADAVRPASVRSTARWLIWSRQYKNEVLARPASAGDFKHIYWDGWGMFAQDTSVYLVFDPNDSLSAASRTRQAGKFDGIPCEVPSVRRLEREWYEVIFYTNEEWGSCSASDQPSRN